MPGVWQRHPRCSLLILGVLATTLYLLVPINHEFTTPPLFNMIDNDLPNRMERAHHIYNKVLVNRKKLIDRFGPSPKDIPVWVTDLFLKEWYVDLISVLWDSFPEDKAPWPPCTVCTSITINQSSGGGWQLTNTWHAGDFFPAAFNCPHEVERHGALGDGGKWVCGLSRVRDKRDCVVYSFGVVPNLVVDVYRCIDHISRRYWLWVLLWGRNSAKHSVLSDLGLRLHRKII